MNKQLNYKFELNGIKINVDLYFTNEYYSTYFMFSHSSMDDAFHSEEFQKLIVLLCTSKAYFKTGNCFGFVCCKTFLYYIYIDPSQHIGICKIDLNTKDGLLKIFHIISKFVSNSEPEKAYFHARKRMEKSQQENIPKQHTVKGIEKKKNSFIINNTRKALQNISNFTQPIFQQLPNHRQ